jgi:uncharacterized protein (DUF1684 family)
VEPDEALAMLDWKRTIFEMYAEVRAAAPEEAWRRWRETRDRLFRTHPQSPLPESSRAEFGGCRYFDYDPAARVLATVSPLEPEPREIGGSTGESFAAVRFALASFDLYGSACSLELYWLEGYAGGLLVPIADATSGETTYGGGRYLLDTVKGSDLGASDGRLVFDFNFAYNPSCAYDPRWSCPLAPPANRLTIAVMAGEESPP